VPVSFDDPLHRYGKLLLAGVAILMALGVAWALWRIRRWRRYPSTAPHGLRGLLLHLVLPLALDLGVTVFFWWLVLSTAGFTLAEYPEIVHEGPDIGFAMALIALLGVGWGMARTALTLRVLRASTA